MRCYRRFDAVKAISFDLDDTLYNNWPIIAKAETAQLACLHDLVPESITTNTQDWLKVRQHIEQQNPHLQGNMGKLRKLGLYHGLLNLGLDKKTASDIGNQAFDAFYQQRIKVVIDPKVINLLHTFADKYPLIALSNGNACIKSMGLGELFEFAIHPGDPDTKPKPWPDMFHQGAIKLGVMPSKILHVGDSLASDVQGALNAGCIAAWYNPSQQSMSIKSTLPHLEVSRLSALTHLL
jgi:putative hydrolase of the HAD superfamily